MSRLADGIIVLRVLKLLATPIEQSDAYRYGIINANGDKIKEPSGDQQKDAYSILNRFVFKVQKALIKSPDRNAKRLLSVAAALAILRENTEEEILDMSDKEFDNKLGLYSLFEDVRKESQLLEHNLVSFKMFREEVAANAVGGGSIHGIGIGPKGEPGRDPVMMPMIRRKKKKNAT